jgi:hypothetical protein
MAVCRATSAACSSPMGEQESRDEPAGQDLPDMGWVVVDSGRELRTMCAEILRPGREHPVVGVSCLVGGSESLVDPIRVREVIGPGIPVYVIHARLTRALGGMLPTRHDVRGGAVRVWWPGVGQDSDPMEHPLILDDGRGNFEQRALERLAHELRLRSPEPVELSHEQQLVLAERQRERAVERSRELEVQLGITRRELAQARAQAGEARLRTLPADTPSPAGTTDPLVTTAEQERAASLDSAQQMSMLICEQWVRHLPNPSDRAQRPLEGYTFNPGFLHTVEQASTPTERVAWVCAMVACGLAPQLNGLNPHPLLTGSGGRQIVRGDGARGWRCHLKYASGGQRLHYWTHSSGLVEFERVGNHDDIGRV